jgi:hypothetical protein
MNHSPKTTASQQIVFSGDGHRPPVIGLRERSAKIRAWFSARMFRRHPQNAAVAGLAGKL